MNPIEWLAINGSERGNQTLIPNSSDSILEINVALMSCRKCLKKEREDHDKEKEYKEIWFGLRILHSQQKSLNEYIFNIKFRALQ